MVQGVVLLADGSMVPGLILNWGYELSVRLCPLLRPYWFPLSSPVSSHLPTHARELAMLICIAKVLPEDDSVAVKYLSADRSDQVSLLQDAFHLVSISLI